MVRSATDATRFTSTTPHASSKPVVKANANSVAKVAKLSAQRTTALPGETPVEKVARLRAAAARAREVELTASDRLVLSGRVWADRLHRFTAKSLILITGIAGVFTIYALGDMMIYNRRKRREYFAEQTAFHQAQLHDARAAFTSGTASEDQLLLLEQEDAKVRELQDEIKAKAEVPKKDGIAKSTWAWLTSDLKKEDKSEDLGLTEGSLGFGSTNETDNSIGARDNDIVRESEDNKSTIQDTARKVFDRERDLHREGGPLDRIGTGGATGKESKNGGWTSFMSKR